MDNLELKRLIRQIAAGYLSRYRLEIPVETSARHVHLSREHLNLLFGAGYELTPVRPLSQPGQFLAKEKVSVITPKGEFAKVSILGPVRKQSQVELSQSDARALGLTPPLRLSGDLTGSGECILLTEQGMVHLKEGVIVVQNHIHMTPEDALRFQVRDMQAVRAKVCTDRPMTFEHVVVRVSKTSRLAFHIDVDEANACLSGRSGTVYAVLVESPSANPEDQGGAYGCFEDVIQQVCQETLCKSEPLNACFPPGNNGTAPPPAAMGKPGKVVTASYLEQLVQAGQTELRLAKSCIITPLARDIAKQGCIQIIREA